MNWEIIKDNYPLAFKEMCGWIQKGVNASIDIFEFASYDDKTTHSLCWTDENGGLDLSCDDPFVDFRDRQLFDFFDDNNLQVHICPTYHQKGISWNWAVYEHSTFAPDCIGDLSTELYGYIGKYKTRTMAEESAFMEAFLLLEFKLDTNE